MRLSALCLLATVFAAPALRAEVAVAVSIPDVNAVHRDFAAGIVDEAARRFEMQAPTLDPSVVSSCGGEEKCVVELARKSGATHVLIIGVAAIGAAEFVVSLRMFDVGSGEVLTGVSDVAAPGRDPREAGAAFAKQAFETVSGVPAPVEKPAPPPTEPAAPLDPRYGGVSPLSLAGWGVVGVAVVGAVGGGALGIFLQQTSSADNRVPTAVIGGAVSAALGVGLGLVVLDQLLAKPSAAR